MILKINVVAKLLLMMFTVLFLFGCYGIQHGLGGVSFEAVFYAPPIILILGLLTGIGLNGHLQKIAKTLCALLLLGLIIFFIVVLNSGGAQSGVGLLIASGSAGILFVFFAIILWLIKFTQHLKKTPNKTN